MSHGGPCPCIARATREPAAVPHGRERRPRAVALRRGLRLTGAQERVTRGCPITCRDTTNWTLVCCTEFCYGIFRLTYGNCAYNNNGRYSGGVAVGGCESGYYESSRICILGVDLRPEKG
jgi:hypothetical protein